MNNTKNLTDKEVVERVRAAVKIAIEKQEAMGIDVVRYDPNNNCFYSINTDGSRRIVRSNVRRVRYSEQAGAKKQKT